jgi:hypothetical protein
MADDILYCNEDGVEYWTVQESGESAVSIRGLARMCGIPESTLRRWLKDLRQSKPVLGLESLLDIDLYLRHSVKKSGKIVTPILMDAALLIVEYAALELGNQPAKFVYREFAKIGANSYAQAKTGWLPKEKQSSKHSRSLIDFLLSNPKAWTMHFSPLWQREACRVTGYRWEASMPMAQFISTYIYKPMGKDVYDRLMTLNADRKSRHHQFFDATADEVVLKEHIQQVAGLLRVSQNKRHFKQLFSDAFSNGIQTDIEFEDIA